MKYSLQLVYINVKVSDSWDRYNILGISVYKVSDKFDLILCMMMLVGTCFKGIFVQIWRNFT